MSRTRRKDAPLPPHEEMARHAAQAAELLKALAHPARLLVLCQLVEGEHSVGELQPITGLSMSALSQHLAVLRAMSLVGTRRDAQTIYYSLADGPAVGVLDALHAAYCATQPRGGRGPAAPRAPAQRGVMRQTVLDRSSATMSAPFGSRVTPTGRPRVLPSPPMKPVTKSTGGPAGRPARKGTKTTR
jgi:DNA-binding transcriptional ArsR family regulator